MRNLADRNGNPVLRQKGAAIDKITPEIKSLIADMLETMKASNGVGLAAQQVGRALQLTVIDVREVKDRPSTLELKGKPMHSNGARRAMADPAADEIDEQSK